VLEVLDPVQEGERAARLVAKQVGVSEHRDDLAAARDRQMVDLAPCELPLDARWSGRATVTLSIAYSAARQRSASPRLGMPGSGE
jgi:hypothetical protein